mgnify:CR=1 FL=1
MESIIHLPMPGQLKIVSVRMAPAISTPIWSPMVVTTGIIALRSAWTPITRRERFRDRKPADRRADAGFLAALIQHFGDEPFVRGNLDAGRLGWLIGREVKPVGAFNPADYEQLLQVDMAAAEASFPELFATDSPPDFGWDDDGWDEGEDEDEADR